MEMAVETRGLTRHFGALRAVEGVTLNVRPGEIFGYLGVNGAGKSTTIKMLSTLLPPTRGTARVAGHDVVREAIHVRRAIGLVGEEGGVDAKPLWTAREYLQYFARLHKIPAARNEVESLLDLMGIERAARRRPVGTYSTGMNRRVEVARAFLGRPVVLFLDEPTRGLDLPSKREMWEFFRGIAQREKVTIFLSSHEVSEILALCRRLAIIAGGRIAFDGEAAALGTDAATFEAALIRLLRSSTPGPRAGAAFQWTR